MPKLGNLGFPPFTRAVKTLVFANVGVFVAMFVAGLVSPQITNTVIAIFGLTPVAVMHGYVWQLVSYSFLHDPYSIFHLLFNMLGLWMFGANVEQEWGARRFYEFYFFCVIGAALTTVAIAHTHLLGMSPNATTVGASGGIFGLLVAFGILFAEMRVYVYGIFPIQARWLAIIWSAIELYQALQGSSGGINNVAHLGGALFALIYMKALPRQGLGFATSEGYYGMINRFHKWKRRRAARKFEVYMREHDRSKYFDEYGNFRDPTSSDDEGKSNGEGRGGWVN